jgi:hypothetical protein
VWIVLSAWALPWGLPGGFLVKKALDLRGECSFTPAVLPCGCQDLHYACGYVDRAHDHVACSG